MCVSYFMLILCTLQLSAFLIVDLLSIKNTLIKIFCMCRRCIYYTMFIYSPLNLNAKNLLRMSRVIIQLEPLIRPVGLSIKFKSTVNRIFFTYHLTYVRKHHHFICHKVGNRSKRINVQIKVIWPVKWVKHLLTLPLYWLVLGNPGRSRKRILRPISDRELFNICEVRCANR